MSKIKLKDQLGRVVRIDGDGATVGRNLRWPDGSIVQESQIRGGTVTTRVVSSGATSGSGASPSATLWKLILEIPANIQKLAALAGVGFAARSTDGEWHQRQLSAGSARITVTNGEGAAGNPTIDIGTLVVDDVSGLQAELDGKFAIASRFAELPNESAVIEARNNLGLQVIDLGTFT